MESAVIVRISIAIIVIDANLVNIFSSSNNFKSMYALLFQTFPTKMMIIVIAAMNVLIQILSVIAKEDAFKKTAMMIMIVEKDIGKNIEIDNS